MKKQILRITLALLVCCLFSSICARIAAEEPDNEPNAGKQDIIRLEENAPILQRNFKHTYFEDYSSGSLHNLLSFGINHHLFAQNDSHFCFAMPLQSMGEDSSYAICYYSRSSQDSIHEIAVLPDPIIALYSVGTIFAAITYRNENGKTIGRNLYIIDVNKNSVVIDDKASQRIRNVSLVFGANSINKVIGIHRDDKPTYFSLDYKEGEVIFEKASKYYVMLIRMGNDIIFTINEVEIKVANAIATIDTNRSDIRFAFYGLYDAQKGVVEFMYRKGNSTIGVLSYAIDKQALTNEEFSVESPCYISTTAVSMLRHSDYESDTYAFCVEGKSFTNVFVFRGKKLIHQRIVPNLYYICVDNKVLYLYDTSTIQIYNTDGSIAQYIPKNIIYPYVVVWNDRYIAQSIPGSYYRAIIANHNKRVIENDTKSGKIALALHCDYTARNMYAVFADGIITKYKCEEKTFIGEEIGRLKDYVNVDLIHILNNANDVYVLQSTFVATAYRVSMYSIVNGIETYQSALTDADYYQILGVFKQKVWIYRERQGQGADDDILTKIVQVGEDGQQTPMSMTDRMSLEGAAFLYTLRSVYCVNVESASVMHIVDKKPSTYAYSRKTSEGQILICCLLYGGSVIYDISSADGKISPIKSEGWHDVYACGKALYIPTAIDSVLIRHTLP